MYPMLMEGVELGTFTYEGSEDEHYYVRNAGGEEFEISERVAHELQKADGTSGLRLHRSVIETLKSNGIIHTSRFVKDDTFNRFILFPIGDCAKKYRNVCTLLNSSLSIIAILTFIAGVSLKLEDASLGGYDFNSFVYYGMLVVSLLLHEIGHLLAGIAYGYDISELGVLLFGVLPAGAYVGHSEKKGVRKCDRIQFSLAGIEMNLLLAGICLLLSMVSERLPMTLTLVANLNVALAMSNLLPAQGLDGENALSHLLGVESINAMARKWLFKPQYRKSLLKSGCKGYACVCLFGLSILSDVAVWLLIALEVLCAGFGLFS